MARGYVKCSVCGQTLGKAGVTSHLRSRHPEIFEEFNTDKVAYYNKHACNQDGTPIKSAPTKTVKAPENPVVETSVEVDTPTPQTPPEPAQVGEAAKPNNTFREPKPKRAGGIGGLFGFTD